MAENRLMEMCIEAATKDAEAVQRWRRFWPTMERKRFHSHLAEKLLARLISRKLVFPSLLGAFRHKVRVVDLSGVDLKDQLWFHNLSAFKLLGSLNLAGCPGVNNHSILPICSMSCACFSIKDSIAYFYKAPSFNTSSPPILTNPDLNFTLEANS